MVRLEFQVKDPVGLLPEAAGRLVKEAIQCTSRVQIRKGEKSGDAKLIFHVLSLSAKAGETLEILVEGGIYRGEFVAGVRGDLGNAVFSG